MKGNGVEQLEWWDEALVVCFVVVQQADLRGQVQRGQGGWVTFWPDSGVERVVVRTSSIAQVDLLGP